MISTQFAIDAGVPDQSVAGTWRIIAKPRGYPVVDATTLRGSETKIGKFSFADPFGPKEMSLTFPQVTVLDRIGVGDLWWIRKHVDVDVIWEGPLPAGFLNIPTPGHGTSARQWRWEGYIASFEHGDDLTVQLKGAMYQLDNWLAKPEYPSRPLPYEWAIARQFLNKPAMRMHPMRIVWPPWWTRRYTPKAGPSYLIPAGVTGGQYWTGLLTRSTGSWEPTLTSYIQAMLTSMYDERGRWTLDLDAYRQPVMFHRVRPAATDPGVLVVDLADPGVKVSLSEDWEQSLTTVYGQSTSLAGVAYTGMQVSSDGAQTSYSPLAYLRQAYPEAEGNDWLDLDTMPKEVYLQTLSGLAADDMAVVARAHLQQFAEPGLTGTITLKSDPLIDGVHIPRHLIRSGSSVHMPRALGLPGGVLAHIVSVDTDLAAGSTTLSIDSKYRDFLTNEEVRLRGRDAMSVTRMLVAGQYQPPVNDQIMPWSYAEGSGMIPSNATYDALRLFTDMPNTVMFPWDTWTTQRPPSDPKWASCYLRLGPAQNNADANWIVQATPSGRKYAVPIRIGQAADIRLLQVAAFDRDGHVLRTPFHISFYYIDGANIESMPRIPAEQVSMFPPYGAAQHYPFVRDGFEHYKIDGTQNDPSVPQPTESVGIIKAYGTFYEKAGFWPGSYAEGDEPTGLLVDESGSFSIDTTNNANAYWDQYKVERNLSNTKAGKIYVMIYCDGQGDQDVYFLGRMYRREPTGEA